MHDESWTLEDYVLSGTYCPDSVVRRTVLRNVERLGSPFVLVVTSRWSVLHTFTEYEGVAPRVADWWRKAGRFNRHRKDVRRRIDVAEAQGRHVLSGPVAGDQRVLEDSGLSDLVVRALTTAELDFLLFCDAARLPQELDDALSDIALHVMSNLKAEVHRDVVRAHPIDALLDRSEASLNPDIYEQLLHLVASATGSGGAELYLRELGSDAFHRVASTGVTPSRAERIAIISTDGGRDSADHVVDVVSRRRPTQGRTLLPDGTAAVVLSMGVPGGSASFTAPPVGVISIFKPLADDNKIESVVRADDYMYLRNAALRVALLSAAIRRRPRSPATRPALTAGTRALDAGATHSGGRDDIPRDVGDALPEILDVLGECRDITDCDSVSFWMMVPETDFPPGGEFALAEACVVPSGDPGSGAPPRPRISDDTSMLVATLRSGETRYVPDTTASSFDDGRPHFGVRTRLAVPVRVEGRVVGVLCLESAHVDYFEGANLSLAGAPIATGLAIGAHISNARMSLTRAQQSLLYPILALRHEARRDAYDLDRRIRDLEATAQDKRSLAAAATVVGKLTMAFGDEEQPSGSSIPRTLLEIVKWAIRERGLQDHQYAIEREPRGETGFLGRGSNADVVGAALLDIARNFVDHADELNPERVVRFGSIVIGGREYDTIVFRNRASAPPDHAASVNAYLAPLLKSTADRSKRMTLGSISSTTQRTQLGTFLAGASLRAVGGHAAMTVNGTVVSTIITLPRSVQTDVR